MTMFNFFISQVKDWYVTKYPGIAMNLASRKAGFKDVNDWLEDGCNHMTEKSTEKLFSYDFMQLKKGKLLEVGSGTGRFTREIIKYLPKSVKVHAFEYSHDYCSFLAKYAEKHNWSQVTIVKGDFYKNNYPPQSFDIVILPWFSHTLSLFKYGKLFEESSRLLKKKGYFIFDFMDANDQLIKKIEEPSNFPYYFVNGNDLITIGNHFGFSKKLDFIQKFNKQVTKFRIYQKR